MLGSLIFIKLKLSSQHLWVCEHTDAHTVGAPCVESAVTGAALPTQEGKGVEMEGLRGTGEQGEDRVCGQGICLGYGQGIPG